MIYSLIIDDADPAVPRQKVREKVDEVLNRPFDPMLAAEYDQERWEREAVESAVRQGFGQVDDPHMVGPR